MRKPIIAGNWKMHNTVKETLGTLKELLPLVENEEADIIICPNFISLSEASVFLSGSVVNLGAQNMHYEDKGAYTGEISPVFLKEIGVKYIILGHSERRHIFGESNDLINKKVKSALRHKLHPILCVGETLAEREKNITYDVIKEQMLCSLADLKGDDLEDLIIAYEPVWAIGTGKTATKVDANEAIGYIRKQLLKNFGEETAVSTRILYGGSVKPDNIKDLMSMEEIDGALVGGASLKALDFSKIINY